MPEIPATISRGDLSALMIWLREHVHGLGSLLTTDELLAHATGKPLDPDILKAHLTQSYLG